MAEGRADDNELAIGSQTVKNIGHRLEFGAVARITCAPPSALSASAAFAALLSMYIAAPSFLARAALSGRPIAATCNRSALSPHFK